MRRFLTNTALASLALLATTQDALTETKDQQQADALRKYLKENFGQPAMQTSWYPQIAGLAVEGKKVAVNTKLKSGSASAREPAESICVAVSGYAFSNQNRAQGLEHIQILGADGVVIVNRRGVSDKCQRR